MPARSPAAEPKAKAGSKPAKGRAAARKAAPVEVEGSESESVSEDDQRDASEEEEEEEEEEELPAPPIPRGGKRQQAAAAEEESEEEESEEEEGSSEDSDSDSDSEEEEEEEEEPVAVAASMLRGRGGGGASSSSSSSSSAETRAFQSMSRRMLAAGKAPTGNLTSQLQAGAGAKKSKQGAAFVVESTFQKSNSIESAQASSNLYALDGGGAGSLKKHKEVHAKTLGKGWFDIAPAKLDEGLRADMKVVQMRNYLDPKRFYKNPDKMKSVIGVGTVVEGPEEFTTQRMTKKERKQTLVGEILADKKIKDYTKRKYGEIQKEKEHASRKKKKMGQRMGVGSGARKIRKLY